MSTYQKRLDMFAAAALTGLLASGELLDRTPRVLSQKSFDTAQLMIKESDRICAEKNTSSLMRLKN